MSAIKLIYAILWFALAIGIGEVSLSFIKEMRGAAIQAHQKGPISHKLFTEQLTSK